MVDCPLPVPPSPKVQVHATMLWLLTEPAPTKLQVRPLQVKVKDGDSRTVTTAVPMTVAAQPLASVAVTL